jgi:hypothetical protein
MDWIDIRKELPKEDGNYLVCASSLSKDKPFIQMAWYDPNGFGWSTIPTMWIPSITHWMPVELPKAEKTWTAGEDIEKGDAVYFRENGGKVFKAQETPFKEMTMIQSFEYGLDVLAKNIMETYMKTKSDYCSVGLSMLYYGERKKWRRGIHKLMEMISEKFYFSFGELVDVRLGDNPDNSTISITLHYHKKFSRELCNIVESAIKEVGQI